MNSNFDRIDNRLSSSTFIRRNILSKNCCMVGKSLNDDKINGPGVATAERSHFVFLLLLPSKNLHKLMSQKGSN